MIPSVSDPEGMQPRLVVDDLSLAFGSRSLFTDLSFEVTAQRACAVTGPSGSGKSTLLSAIAGWRTPAAGRITRHHIRKVCWVFQGPVGTARRNALDHVTLPILARGSGVAAAAREATSILQGFGLLEVAGNSFGSLSGGEKQRLMLARAVASAPSLLLVDEPTAQLDRSAAELVADSILQLNGRGMVVIIASHDVEVIARCGQVVEIART